jgi:hypothetical protein
VLIWEDCGWCLMFIDAEVGGQRGREGESANKELTKICSLSWSLKRSSAFKSEAIVIPDDPAELSSRELKPRKEHWRKEKGASQMNEWPAS